MASSLLKGTLAVASLAASGLLVAPATSGAATTPTLTQATLSFNRAQAGLPLTATLQVTTSAPVTVDGLTVAVRDASGHNYDFPLQGATTVGPQGITYHQTRSLPAGTYDVYGAYVKQGGWHNLPTQKLTVWSVPGKQVTFPSVSSTQEYPLTNQFANSAWTVGHTSAYPGATTGSTSQVNPGDHKSDCLNPAWSAPTAEGWFGATRALDSSCQNRGVKNPWKTTLVTTRHSDLSGTQVATGDSITATLTLPKEQGSWPALWTWSDNGGAAVPQGHGEVDLFENHGDTPATLEHTNWVTTTRPNYCWNPNSFTPGKPFGLQVDFNQSSVDYWVNGVKTCSLPGVPSNWKAYLTVSESVDAGDTSYHSAPKSGVNSLQGFKVTDLSLWRPQAVAKAAS